MTVIPLRASNNSINFSTLASGAITRHAAILLPHLAGAFAQSTVLSSVTRKAYDNESDLDDRVSHAIDSTPR